MNQAELKIYQVAITDLNPATYNPRKWDESAIKNLKESIKRFGLIDPIIANKAENRKNIVIGGHFRLKIAKDLRFNTVPVVYVHIPEIEREKELNLRLNRNTGDWDYELLKDFNVELLLDVGFNDADLSHIWDDQLGTEDDDFDLEKTIAEIGTPKTKLGDLYQLGRHRLVCGDATDPAVVKRLGGSKLASMIYVDPPYNISLDYHKGVSTGGKYGGKTQDSKTDTEYEDFLSKLLTNALNVSLPDCHIFCWCDESYIGLLQSLYPKLGIGHKRVCLWLKNNHNMTPQIAFNKVYEPCVYGVRGKPYLSASIKNLHEIFNKEVDTGNRMFDDVMDLFNIWLAKRVPAQEYDHPTQKPITLHEKPLRRCTKAGDMVLDLCGGSGSTLLACEQMNRVCYMSEIEPIFSDVIIRRFQDLTGKEAVRVNQ